MDDIDQNNVEEIENDVVHEKEDYTLLEPEIFQPSTNEQEGMFIYLLNLNCKSPFN